MSSSNLNTQALIQKITLAEAKDAIREMIGRWIIIGEGFVFSQKTVGAWITTTASIEKYLLQQCKPYLTDAEFQELIVFALDKVTSQPIRLKKVEYFSFLPHGGITPAPGEHPEYRELKKMLEKQLAPNPRSDFINPKILSASFILLAMITVASIMPAVAAVASSNELSSNDESHDVALLNPSEVATIGAIKQLALEDMYREIGVGDLVDVASYEERTAHHIFSVAESLVAFSQGWMIPESEARLIEFLLGNKNVISKLNLIFNNASNKPLLYKTIAKLSHALVVKVSGEGLYGLKFDFSPATDGRPHNSNYLIVLLGQVIMQMQKDDLSKISPDELLHMYLILHYFKMYRINEKETIVSEQINRIRAAIGPDFDRLMLKRRKASAKRLGMKFEELFPEARLTVEATANSAELSNNDENSDGTLTALNILDQELTRGIGGLALQNMDKITKAKEEVSAFELRFREDAIFLANKLINFCNEAVTLKDKEYLMYLLLEDKNSAPILNLVLHSASNKPLLHRIIAKLSYELNAEISGDGRQRVILNLAPTTDGRPRNANYLISSLGEVILQIPESDLSIIPKNELLRMHAMLHLFKLLHPNAESDVDKKKKQIHSALGQEFDALILADREKIERKIGAKLDGSYSEKTAKKSVAEENPSATGYGFITLLQIFMAAAFIWLAIRIKNGAFTMQGCYYAAQRLIQDLKLAQFDFDKNNDCIVTNYQLLAFLGSSDRINLLKELLSTDKVSVDVRRLADDRFKIIIPYMNRHDRAAYNRHLESLAEKADFSNLEEKSPSLKKHLKRRMMPVLNRYLPTLSKSIFKIDIIKDQGVVLTFNILNKLHIPEDVLNVFNQKFVRPWTVVFPFDALDKDGYIKPDFEKTLKEMNEDLLLWLETVNKALSSKLDAPQDQGSQNSTHVSNAGKSLRAAVSVAPEPISYNDNTKPIEKTVGSSKTLEGISKDLERLFEELILSSDSGSLTLQKDESRKQIILELDGDKYYINRPIGERPFYLSNIALRNLMQTFFINIKVPEEGIRIQNSRKRKYLCKITLINPTGLMLDNARLINQRQASLFKRLSQLANVYHPMEIKLDYSEEHYNVVFKLNEDNLFEIEPYGLSGSSFLRCVKQSLMAAKMTVNDIGEGNQFSVPLQDITQYKDELHNKEQFLALKNEGFEADEKKELQEGKEEEKESEADKIVEEKGTSGKGKHRKPKANIPHQKSTGRFFNKKIQNIGSSSSAFLPKFDERNETTEIRRLVKVINFRLLSLEAVKNEDNLLELYLALANLLERLTKCVKQFERVGVIVPIWFRNIHEPQSLMRLRAIVIKNLNYPNHYDFVRLVAGNFCKAIILSEAEEGFSIPYPINIDKITSDCLFKAELSVCLEKGEDFNELERNIDYDEIIALIEKLKSCYKQDADEKLLSKWVQCHILLVRALILRMSELFTIKNTQSPYETESKLGSALYNVLQNARAMRNDIAHPSGQQGAPAVLEEAAFIIELSKLEKPQSSSSGPSRSRRG